MDLLSAIVFAITGALVASRKQMDVIGFMWLSVVTGVGGGTVRDLLLGVPVFWIERPSIVIACLATAAVLHFTSHLFQSRYTLILWFDAFGMALVTIAGTAKGLDIGTAPVIAVVMGVITASVGGIIRDILGHEPSIILRREIYVTASVFGACVYVLTVNLDAGRVPAAAAGLAAAFFARVLAISFGWSMPTFRPRPGRDPVDTDKDNDD
nr:trimeric intracellular cation channel family protein [Oricola nitratireducens]